MARGKTRFLRTLGTVSMIGVLMLMIKDRADHQVNDAGQLNHVERDQDLQKKFSDRLEQLQKQLQQNISKVKDYSKYIADKVKYDSKKALQSSSGLSTKRAAEIKHILGDGTNGDVWKLTTYLRSPSYICDNKVRLGSMKDGGWYVCLDSGFELTKPCLVYSFGIRHDFTFDDHISNSYGCETHSFDPSMGVNDYKRSSTITFHNLGLLGIPNANWTMADFSTIRKQLKHEKKVIDVLKVDIEGSEYSAFDSMVRDGHMATIKQIGLEMHLSSHNKQLHFPLLLSLEEAGFRKYHYDPNERMLKHNSITKFHTSTCHEIYYINTRYLPH